MNSGPRSVFLSTSIVVDRRKGEHIFHAALMIQIIQGICKFPETGFKTIAAYKLVSLWERQGKEAACLWLNLPMNAVKIEI